MHRVSNKHLIYAMSPKNEPVLTVEAGSVVTFETCDCFEDQIQSADVVFNELDWNRVNPATGPVFVEGAEPGDILAVEIQKIKIGTQAVMVTGPNLGVLGSVLTENIVKVIPVTDNHVQLDSFSIPLNPMIGVIGTAPKEGSISCGTPDMHGGNMDCKQMREGTTLLLPVNVPGALFALGDLHAAMADGEASVCGAEIAGEVTVKLTVIKGKKWPLPMAVNQEHVMTIVSHKELDVAADQAVIHMVNFLHDEYHVPKADAISLISLAGDVRICQIVDPLKTARVELPIQYLEQVGFSREMLK
ncbi:acetamidase/formamidase family protein [Brevibacillus daliensis]|uniref:acetamidase/formamidase family protein n=1 Tax=Brevibacillus daliensis TaxID=2892995 RepID=UPI001E64FA77|nr:acetamidase/formamidase family protein [Brevibacillus daliensis]